MRDDMMMVQNNGQEIIDTNYFSSDYAKNGKTGTGALQVAPG